MTYNSIWSEENLLKIFISYISELSLIYLCLLTKPNNNPLFLIPNSNSHSQNVFVFLLSVTNSSPGIKPVKHTLHIAIQGLYVCVCFFFSFLPPLVLSRRGQTKYYIIQKSKHQDIYESTTPFSFFSLFPKACEFMSDLKACLDYQASEYHQVQYLGHYSLKKNCAETSNKS